MKRQRPVDHIKELGALVARLQKRIESRKKSGLPISCEQREIAAVRWVVAEASSAMRGREDLKRTIASLRLLDEECRYLRGETNGGRRQDGPDAKAASS